MNLNLNRNIFITESYWVRFNLNRFLFRYTPYPPPLHPNQMFKRCLEEASWVRGQTQLLSSLSAGSQKHGGLIRSESPGRESYFHQSPPPITMLTPDPWVCLWGRTLGGCREEPRCRKLKACCRWNRARGREADVQERGSIWEERWSTICLFNKSEIDIVPCY